MWSALFAGHGEGVSTSAVPRPQAVVAAAAELCDVHAGTHMSDTGAFATAVELLAPLFDVTEFDVWGLLAAAADPALRARVAADVNCPAAVRDALFADPAAVVRVAVATRTAAASVLEVLSSDSSEEVRRAVAFNTDTPPNALTRLVTDTGDMVQLDVLYNQAAPLAALEAYMASPSGRAGHDVSLVAKHRACSPQLLGELVEQHDSVFVHREAAANTAATPELLEVLAASQHPEARAQVGYRLDCPERVLEELLEDSSLDVARAAAHTRAMLRGDVDAHWVDELM